MRVAWAVFLVVCLVPGLLRAQVDVELRLEHDRYLQDESLPVSVRIVNRSGQTLQLGQAPGWLTFSMETSEGIPVVERRRFDFTGPFSIETAASAVKEVDLMPYFQLSRVARYKVRAKVRIDQWSRDFASPAESFDIGRGVKIWEQEFGLPGDDGVPEVRRYSLVQANYQKRPMLYARVTDARETKVIGVRALGPVVSFSRPEQLIDREGCLHTLFQTGASLFLHCRVDPEGKLRLRQTYSYFRSRPALHSQEGELSVVGGVRRISPEDIPPPPREPILNHANGATP